jgi:cytoskeletal protein CcmA (bactofilin family)
MMKNVLKVFSVLLLALFFLLPAQPAAAASGTLDGQVIFGQVYVLKSGDTMEGNLLVFGGSATIEKDATVNGSVVLFGGTLKVDGTVNGDVAVTGGQVFLGAEAHVTGNLTTVAATLDQTDGSRVDGQIYNTTTTTNVANGDNHPTVTPPVVNVPPLPWINRLLEVHIPNGISTFWNAFSQSVGLALLAMLLMLFLAPHTERVARAILAQPVTAGGLGLLTLIVAPFAILFTAITIILIPVSVIIIVALIVAGIFGWIAVGYEIGQRFTKAIHQTWHPAFAAGLGVFTITIVAKALTAIPVLNCIGWLVPFVFILAALGAVIMTRFGLQVVAAPVKAAQPPLMPPTDQNPG